MRQNFLLCASALLTLVFTAAARADLAWETTQKHVAGDDLHSEVTTVFRFTNRTERAVTIKDVVTSCGCTTAALRQRTFRPGESGEIAVVVRYTGDVSPLQEVVTVTTDEPQAKPRDLTVHVTVPVRSLETGLVPAGLVWKRHDQPAPRIATLRVPASGDFVPLRVESDDPAFAPTLKPARADDPFAYEISVTPRDTARERAATVRVITSDKDTPLHRAVVYELKLAVE